MKKLLLILVSTSLLIQSQAQVNPELQSLIRQSFTYFPKFNELQQAVEISSQRVDLASTGKLPEIGAVATYNYVSPVAEAEFPIGNTLKTLQFQPNNNVNFGINIYQPLIDFGRTRLNVEKARHALQESKLNIEYNQAQMAAQVAGIYYTLVYLQQAIDIQDSVIAVLRSNKELVESKYRNGDALKVDVLTIQNSINIEQNRKTDLLNALQKQRNLLTYTSGQQTVPAGKSFDFGSTDAAAESALQLAEKQGADFQSAMERIQAAETEVQLSRVSRKPTLGLNGSTGVRNGYQPDINQWRFNYGIGVALNVPIFAGGRLRKQEGIAEATVKSSQLALISLTHQYKKDIQQALIDRETNSQRLQTVEEQIQIAREALRLAESRFRNGVSTNLELLNANTNLQKIELSRIQYQYQLTMAEIELARLEGRKYW